jgi:peptide/nickel transport system permease protein
MSSIFQELEDDAPGEQNVGSEVRKRSWQRYASMGRDQLRVLSQDTLFNVASTILLFFTALAIVGPLIAPHRPQERLYKENGVLIDQWAEPAFMSSESTHLLGTTAQGYDIFSQLIYATRPALIVGFLAAVLTVSVGTSVGLIAGYYGGAVDQILMRIVDFAYGLPLLPTVIVFVAIIGPSFENIVLGIVLLQWRGSARVIRSQVLSLRERPFVKAAKITGASDLRIIVRHIAPNVLSLSFLYASFAIGWAILTEAGVSFLGLGDPNRVSWGTMLQSARAYSAVAEGAWWWFIPPGICISLVVLSGFLIGRAYEEIVQPELRMS